MSASQHLRSTPGRIRASRLAFPTAMVLGATLALSGCGAQQAGAAAIVDGVVIGDKDVQTVAHEVNQLGGEPLTSNAALFYLILAPYVLAEAKRAGKTVAPSQARLAIAKVADPSPSTIEFVQMQLSLGQLDESNQLAVVKALSNVKITVNPRYGQFDTKNPALNPVSHNWFKAAAASPAK